MNEVPDQRQGCQSRDCNHGLARQKRKARLEIERCFSTPGVHPFEQIEWENRTAKIADENGKAIFEQKDVEVPVHGARWRQVVVSKYFYGDAATASAKNSVKQLIHRVCVPSPTAAKKTAISTPTPMRKISIMN